MITVTFACGHRFDVSGMDAPICPTCQERRVQRVKAPAPRFTGVCAGPSVDTKALDAIPVGIPKER